MTATRDVVVIGSGIIGCAIAYELGRRGASVLTLDDRTPGSGATQASAGMLAPYNEIDEEGPHLDLTVRGLDVFDRFVTDVVAASARPVQYRRSGTLTVAVNDEAQRRLAGLAHTLADRGIDAQLFDAEGVRREEPSASPAAVGGLLIPSHGYVAATELTAALVAAAQRAGATFTKTSRAGRIRQQGHAVVVSIGSDEVSAAHVVIAAGSWAGQIQVEGANAPAPIHPVRGQLLHLKATGANLRRVTWGERCYLVPWDDGSLLVGATVELAGFDERTTAQGMRDLLVGLAEVLTPDWPATVVSARAGLRPGSPDGLPIIGASAAIPNVMYATGHYRNGVLLAPITALLVADALLEGRVDPIMNATSPARFGGL